MTAESTSMVSIEFVAHLSEALEGNNDDGRFTMDPESTHVGRGEDVRVSSAVIPNAVSLMTGAPGDPPPTTE